MHDGEQDIVFVHKYQQNHIRIAPTVNLDFG